jgi:hypothetical protein
VPCDDLQDGEPPQGVERLIAFFQVIYCDVAGSETMPTSNEVGNAARDLP